MKFKFFGDVLPRWVLTRYIPLVGGVGFYRGFNSRKKEDLVLYRTVDGLANGIMYITAPYVPALKQIGRWEIEYFKPHLREKNKKLFDEFVPTYDE